MFGHANFMIYRGTIVPCRPHRPRSLAVSIGDPALTSTLTSLEFIGMIFLLFPTPEVVGIPPYCPETE